MLTGGCLQRLSGERAGTHVGPIFGKVLHYLPPTPVPPIGMQTPRRQDNIPESIAVNGFSPFSLPFKWTSLVFQ